MLSRRMLIAVFAIAGLAAPAARAEVEPLTIKGDKFYCGDAEFRIWGFNISRGMNLDEQRYIQNANRLGFLGVNFVRLHTLAETQYGEGPGPWSTGILPVEGSNTREFINLENFWRLINGLKDKRIYFCIDLVMGRRFVPGDSGILDTTGEDRKAWEEAIGSFERWNGEHKRALTYLPMFDERVLALTKEYIEKLLNLRNPRTGALLKDDPAFALIETANENYGCRLIRAKALHRVMPAYFRDKLARRWAEWLAAKYGTDDKLRQAWTQEGRKGLLGEESLAKGAIDLAPVHPEFGEYSDVRNADFLAFLTDLDMQFQRTMRDHYRAVGYKGLTIFGDLNNAAGGNDAQRWMDSDLAPFLEDHEYPPSNLDLLGWSNVRITLVRAPGKANPYDFGRPYWRSEVYCTSWQAPAYPLFTAVYFALTGLDGATFFVWDMDNRKSWYGTTELLKDQVDLMKPVGDYPWQMVFRAAGRLYKSGEISPVTDAKVLEQFSQGRGNVQTEQVHRANNEGLLTAETEHFVALASNRPVKRSFKSMDLDITSDKLNVLVAELLPQPDPPLDEEAAKAKREPVVEYEITATGMAGGTVDHKYRYNDWDPLTYVRGTVTFKGGAIGSVTHLDMAGKPIRTTDEHGATMELVDGVRLYRVRMK